MARHDNFADRLFASILIPFLAAIVIYLFMHPLPVLDDRETPPFKTSAAQTPSLPLPTEDPEGQDACASLRQDLERLTRQAGGQAATLRALKQTPGDVTRLLAEHPGSPVSEPSRDSP